MPSNQQRRDAAKRHLQRQNERRVAQSKATKQRLAIVGVVAAVVVVVGAIWFFSGGNGKSDDAAKSPAVSDSEGYNDGDASADPTGDDADSSDDSAATDEAAKDAGTCSYPTSGSAAKPVDPPTNLNPPDSGTVDATIALNSGDVEVELDQSRTPCTTNSFVSLAEQGYFDGISCHRLTASSSLSVLQCGDPSGTGAGGPGYSFADELDGTETYEAGTLAMANAGPDTNGSQFFLVYADSQLPPSYTVFGHITDGMDVLKAIADKGISGGGQDGAPADPVTIKSVTVS